MLRKDDRRVQRTRKLLRESMLQLILERGYDDISIQDVTDKANLGRATFYLHYREKDDLLADVMRMEFEELVAIAPPVISPKTRSLNPKRLRQVFEFAESHYDLFRLLMISKGSMVAMRSLQQAFRGGYKSVIDRMQENYGVFPIISRDFLENYYAGALISLIFWWLDNDMPFTTEEMAEMYMKVSMLNAMNVLDGDKESLVSVYTYSDQPEQEEAQPRETVTKKPGRPPKTAQVVKPKPNEKQSD